MVMLSDVVCTLDALEPIEPRISRALESPAPRIQDVVLPLLVEYLAGCDPFLLVLDDLEVVTHPGSLAILSFLVEHVPPGSQLVPVSRTEPQVPLARWRAAGEVLDLRAADLALDASETRELLAAGGLNLSDEPVHEVRERAEGWAAGIALALLSPDRRAVARNLPLAAIGSSDDVSAYLIEEAVESQPSDVRRFLLSSSVLRRMCAALCDHALEIETSGQVLAALKRESLFVVPLDDEGVWHRYHHLFRELLQTELRRQAPEVIPEVLGRAAAWHEENGDVGEAFEYAHASGDLGRAGRILLRHGHDLVGRGQVETVRTWLQRCTPEEIASDTMLALAGAWVALLLGGAAEALRLGWGSPHSTRDWTAAAGWSSRLPSYVSCRSWPAISHYRRSAIACISPERRSQTHADSVYRKLEVSSRSAAVERLEALGLGNGRAGVLPTK